MYLGWGRTGWEPTIGFESHNALIALVGGGGSDDILILMYLGETCNLGTYSLRQPTVDLTTHSLRWLAAELARTVVLLHLGLDLQVGNLQ